MISPLVLRHRYTRKAPEDNLGRSRSPVVARIDAQREAWNPLELPSLADYHTLWSRIQENHLPRVSGVFSNTNLVPEPRAALWQDAPEIRIERLVTEAAKGRLSICKMESALEESGYVDGRACYAHVARETMF